MATISTSKLSQIAGLQLPVLFLKSLGIKPDFETSSGGAMWNESDVNSILIQVGLHFINKTVLDPDAPYGYKKNGDPAKKRGRKSRHELLMKEIK